MRPRQEQKPNDEGLRSLPTIYLCTNCGEELGMKKRVSCLDELSASGRAARVKENAEVDARLAQLREKKEWIYATA